MPTPHDGMFGEESYPQLIFFFLFWCFPSNELHQFRLHSLSKNILPKSVLPPILCCPEAHSCVKWYASHQGSSPHSIPITTIYVETELGHNFAWPFMLCQDHETLPSVPVWRSGTSWLWSPSLNAMWLWGRSEQSQVNQRPNITHHNDPVFLGQEDSSGDGTRSQEQ